LVELRGERTDLRRWDSLPQGFYLKAFAPLASGEVATLHHPDWGTALEVVTRARQQLHLGIWLNRGGFPEGRPVEHLALEPTFGAADALSRALEMGNCLFLAPGGEERWTVTYRIVELS
jgi:galactose mutarotase-like enzyme